MSMGSDKIMSVLNGIGQSGATLARVALLARGSRPAKSISAEDKTLYILGNGPSLRQALDDYMPQLAERDTLAVNFAANTPDFFALKPKYYVLADPHFFDKPDDPNVSKLMLALRSVDWGMRLFVPHKALEKAKRVLSRNISDKAEETSTAPESVKIEGFNFLAVEGMEGFCHLLMRKGLGMPRPRNVLIPSIMIGIWLGYRRICILGADHTWLKTLSVTDKNRVVSVQPHFYKEDGREEVRVSECYGNVRLWQVLESMMIAFRSYHYIRRFAEKEGVEIVNVTPGSYIDAFERADLGAEFGKSK